MQLQKALVNMKHLTKRIQLLKGTGNISFIKKHLFRYIIHRTNESAQENNGTQIRFTLWIAIIIVYLTLNSESGAGMLN